MRGTRLQRYRRRDLWFWAEMQRSDSSGARLALAVGALAAARQPLVVVLVLVRAGLRRPPLHRREHPPQRHSPRSGPVVADRTLAPPLLSRGSRFRVISFVSMDHHEDCDLVPSIPCGQAYQSPTKCLAYSWRDPSAVGQWGLLAFCTQKCIHDARTERARCSLASCSLPPTSRLRFLHPDCIG